MQFDAPRYSSLESAFAAQVKGDDEELARWLFYSGAASMLDLLVYNTSDKRDEIMRELRLEMDRFAKRASAPVIKGIKS